MWKQGNRAFCLAAMFGAVSGWAMAGFLALSVQAHPVHECPAQPDEKGLPPVAKGAVGGRKVKGQSPVPITFSGKNQEISVIDGDTFWLGIHKIRIRDIDALESAQRCHKADREIQCAEMARRQFEKVLKAARDLKCVIQYDRYGRPAMDHNRYLATCYDGNLDIGKLLIETGWVLVGKDSQNAAYRRAEDSARAKALGLHGYSFEKPWDFRRKKRAKKECRK